MDRIIYLDRDHNEISYEQFLRFYERQDIDFDRLKSQIKCFDFTGTSYIKKNKFLDSISLFSENAVKFILDSILFLDNNVYFRGKNYYLNERLRNPQEIIKEIISKIPRLEDILEEMKKKDKGFSESELTLLLLDHKKHYSMIALSALYDHMLKDSEFPEKTYHKFLDSCEADIKNYYQYFLTGKYSDILSIKESDLATLLEIELPKDTERDSAGSKLVFREMDHPCQLIVYTGNLLDVENAAKIDIVVNPLFGAIEIGYAIKGITQTLGIDTINKINLFKYSLHRKNHEQIDYEDPSEHYPLQLQHEFNEINGKKIIIIDDMYNTGTTLKRVRDFFRQFSSEVLISAVETNYRFQKAKGTNLKCLDPSDLYIPSISDWRYVRGIEKTIKERMKK